MILRIRLIQGLLDSCELLGLLRVALLHHIQIHLYLVELLLLPGKGAFLGLSTVDGLTVVIAELSKLLVFKVEQCLKIGGLCLRLSAGSDQTVVFAL